MTPGEKCGLQCIPKTALGSILPNIQRETVPRHRTHHTERSLEKVVFVGSTSLLAECALERKARRSSRSSVQSSDMHAGALPFNALYTVKQSLYVIRSSTLNQCRLLRSGDIEHLLFSP